jgi:hypothetical protein
MKKYFKLKKLPCLVHEPPAILPKTELLTATEDELGLIFLKQKPIFDLIIAPKQ